MEMAQDVNSFSAAVVSWDVDRHIHINLISTNFDLVQQVV